MFCAFVGLNLYGLTRSPIIWIDEVTLNEPAKELALHGIMRSLVFAGSQKMEELYTWQPPGYPLMMGAVFKAFGFGLWQLRLPSLVFGGAAIALLFVFALLMFQDRHAAVLASLLLALDPSFIVTARSARMDTACMAFVIAALIFSVGARQSATERIRKKHVALSGLAIGLACMMHPLAGAWGVVLLIMYIAERPRTWIRTTLIFGSPTIAFMTAWIGTVVVVQSPSVFYRQFIQHGLVHLERGSFIDRIAGSIQLLDIMYSGTPVYFLVFGLGIAWLVKSYAAGRHQRNILVLLCLAPLLWWALAMDKKSAMYVLHTSICLVAVSGRGMAAAFRFFLNAGSRWRRVFAHALEAAFVAHMFMSGLFVRIHSVQSQWEQRDYRPITRMIRSVIPPGSRVWIHPHGERGAWFTWPAVVESGSSMHVLGNPDPEIHQYAITSPGDDALVGNTAVKVGEITGESVRTTSVLCYPPVWDGMSVFPTMVIWRLTPEKASTR